MPRGTGWLSHPTTELACRWILGATFVFSSLHKIVEPAVFARIIYGYGLFPDVIINLTAIVLPYLELVTGAALLIGIYPRGAALLILGMLAVFAGAVAINLIRGHEFDCGCFAIGEAGRRSAGWQVLIRDIVYFLLAVQVLRFDGHRRLCLYRYRCR